jgi:hypothetical protein
LKVENLPENNAMDAFAEALALAWKEFGDTSAVVLMVVHKEEGNMYDQYWLALRLWELDVCAEANKLFQLCITGLGTHLLIIPLKL